jgi:mannose-1-phosphate guanylyltransferase
MGELSSLPVRRAIVLSAGDGQRLRPLIYTLRGDNLPKQYLNIIGKRSMLEHTLRRLQTLMPPEDIVTVIGQHHLQYPEVRLQLSDRPQGTVIVQPENKGTAPGVLLPLMHIYTRDPESVVAIFPSDHFILQEDLFMGYVDLAYRVVELNPSLAVLMGVNPNTPSPEMGYILPNESLAPSGLSCVRQVREFVEKPSSGKATEMMREGAIWNTMVIVSQAKTLLHIIRALVPRLYQTFQKIRGVIGSSKSTDVIRKMYRDLESVNFSKGVLELLPQRSPSQLAVLPVRSLFWRDLGSEDSIVNTLQHLNDIGQPYTTRIRHSQGAGQTGPVAPRVDTGPTTTVLPRHGRSWTSLNGKERDMNSRSMTPENQPSTSTADLILNGEMVRERIAKKAYELWEQRGRLDGHDVEDWLEAAHMVLDECVTQEPSMPKAYEAQRSRIQSERKRSAAII